MENKIKELIKIIKLLNKLGIEIVYLLGTISLIILVLKDILN